VRERVLEKAGYQCQYQGPRGGFIGRASTRCTQKTGLEVDHLKAFAKRGPATKEIFRCFARLTTSFGLK